MLFQWVVILQKGKDEDGEELYQIHNDTFLAKTEADVELMLAEMGVPYEDIELIYDIEIDDEEEDEDEWWKG